jgi:hypothetical protein
MMMNLTIVYSIHHLVFVVKKKTKHEKHEKA